MFIRVKGISPCVIGRTLKHVFETACPGYKQATVLSYATVTNSHRQGQGNVILMGSPGCGKTTVGQLLGPKLGMSVLDIDDHHLEPYWGMSVAQKLAEVGSSSFVEEEGKALLELNVTGKVISLTGSNPMYKPAMEHIAKSSTVVFLDTPSHNIIQRLEEMKVNRIVGQDDGVSMETILKYRQQFYEGSYDVRILVEENESAESIANKVALAMRYYKEKPGYLSTRQKTVENQKLFSDVILEGLAPDGGLFVPGSCVPTLSLGEIQRLVDSTYAERALKILERWIHPSELHPSRLSQFLSRAYCSDTFGCSKVFPVRHLGGNQHLLELFHGPTASFKDAALQLMPQFFVEALKTSVSGECTKYLIVVATSGDTGGAVLDGFIRHAGDTNIGVIVLYPDEGISDVQKHQMTSMAGNNIRVTGVQGDFDVCQSLVKRAFRDQRLASELLDNSTCKLSAANSINWGRLLPQVVYHVSAYLDLVQRNVIKNGDVVDLCIPTGNFGNILAAYYAKNMGIPFRRLICASNSNNILTEFIKTGIYDLRNRTLYKTTSPAIDILVSSNLERYLFHLSGGRTDMVSDCFRNLESAQHFSIDTEMLSAMHEMFVADWCSEEDVERTILSTLHKTGYLLDPHTAVAKAVGDRLNQEDCPMVIASTAHYSKFGPDVARFIGIDTQNRQLQEILQQLQGKCTGPAMHIPLQESMKRPNNHTKDIGACYTALTEEIINFAQTL